MRRADPTVAAGAALSVTLLAPMVAHLTWRPLAVALGGVAPGVAPVVSWAAVALALLGAWVGLRRGPRRGAGWGLAGGTALALGGLMGGGAAALSLLGVVVFAAVTTPRIVAALPPLSPRPWQRAAWGVTTALGVVMSVHLATYLGDPWATGYGLDWDPFIHRHLCFTAYMHAAELATAGVGNIYDLAHVAPLGAALPDTAAHMAPFTLDRYGYPPQFLLVPLALQWLIPDFMAQRAAWTCGNALFVAYALWRIGLWVGPRGGRIARALSPMLWLLSGMVFQSGNVQLTVLAVGVLAMIAFDEGRDQTGGLLLASVTLAKIAPGLLGIILLVQRRWRAVGWTVAWAVGLSAISLGVVGPAPFEDFLGDHLPRISSGEAYDFLDDTRRAVLENLAPFGLPFKLQAMGVDWDPWVWGPRFGHAFTALAVGLTAWVARRRLDRRASVATWLLVLTLAGLRSPMAPGYLLAGVFWALTLAAPEAQRPRAWAMGLGLGALMVLATPLVPMTLGRVLAGQAAMHGVTLWLLLRRWDSPAPQAKASPRDADPMALAPTAEVGLPVTPAHTRNQESVAGHCGS